MSDDTDHKRIRRRIGAAGLAAGLALGGYGIASATSGGSTATTTTQTATTPAYGVGSQGTPARHFWGFRRRPPELAAAAKALDMTPSALVTQLRSGKSVADVAKAKGIDPQTVIDAIVADVKSRLADRVQAGDITQAQADDFATDLSTRVAAFVNGTRPPGAPPFFQRFRGRPPELATAAKAIGITPSALVTQLRSGKSIADAAKARGIDPQTVTDAIVADVKSRLADRVKAGDITQAQADDFATGLSTRVTAFVNGTRPPGEPGFFAMRRGPVELAAAAKALDMTPSALVTQLRSGKSVADVAKAKGIDPQTVIDAIVADAKSRLADRVKAGDITQALADDVTADLSTRVTAFVNGTRPAGVPGTPWIGGPPGPGGPPGLGPFGP
jgi:uncharacterized protein (DUF433 family)